MSIDVALQNSSNHLSIPVIDEFQCWVDCAIQVSAVTPPGSCEEIGIMIVDKVKSADLNSEFRQSRGRL